MGFGSDHCAHDVPQETCAECHRDGMRVSDAEIVDLRAQIGDAMAEVERWKREEFLRREEVKRLEAHLRICFRTISENERDLAAAQAENERLRAVMREVYGHTACAVTQSIDSDDHIIVGHLRDATEILRAAISVADRRDK